MNEAKLIIMGDWLLNQLSFSLAKSEEGNELVRGAGVVTKELIEALPEMSKLAPIKLITVDGGVEEFEEFGFQLTDIYWLIEDFPSEWMDLIISSGEKKKASIRLSDFDDYVPEFFTK
jgi:hypothetical protein